MKKFTFLLIATIFLLTSCGKEKTFDENLRKAWKSVGQTLVHSGEACDDIYRTCHTAIYDHKTPSGEYCSDFNNALKEMYETLKKNGKIDSIYLYKDEMIENTSLLTPPPTSRKECYDDFLEIVDVVSAISRMATDPTGSFSSYREEAKERVETIARLIDQFKIKYSAYLK